MFRTWASMKILTLVILTGMTGSAFAQEKYRRLVDFEWEAIEGATAYEVELRKKEGDKEKPVKNKVTEPLWKGRLTPGQYVMRLRALDYRGVPGDWSEDSDFDVGLENVSLIHPPPRGSLVSKDSKEDDVEFRWSPVGGASFYRIEVTSDDGAFKKVEELKATKITFEIPAAKSYTWKVVAHADEQIRSDATSVSQFSFLGQKLEKPKIEKPENQFVRELKWSRPDEAQGFDVVLARRNPQSKKWEKFQSFENVKDSNLNFEENWPGGDYRVQVRAKGDFRPDSDVANETFKVRNGNRSPAAEFNAEVRKSIDRINGWYGIASYLITMIKYSSSDLDTLETSGVSTGIKYNALGGTGRLGLGWFKEEKAWGFLSIVDFSGFLDDKGKNQTYASGEANAVYRTQINDRNELRTQMGLFYKENVVARGRFDIATQAGAVESYQRAEVLGPHVGAEYWFSLTPKLGFQVNAHLYLNLIKVKTPNGQALNPTMSNQFGFLGSYRLNRRFTGLMGYARREDRVQYKSISDAAGGQSNEAVLTGDYLNFYAEYAF